MTQTTSSSNGTVTITEPKVKIKRERKPWVYQSDYDQVVKSRDRFLNINILFGVLLLASWAVIILMIVG